MKLLLALLVLFSADIAWGEGEYSLRLTEFSIEYHKYTTRRDAYYPDYPTQGRWEGGSKVNYTLGAFRYLYWRNSLHFSYEKVGGQIRDAGWEYEAGAKLFSVVDIYKFHHSTHGLEYQHPNGLKFNVVDTYGIRLNLIK